LYVADRLVVNVDRRLVIAAALGEGSVKVVDLFASKRLKESQGTTLANRPIRAVHAAERNQDAPTVETPNLIGVALALLFDVFATEGQAIGEHFFQISFPHFLLLQVSKSHYRSKEKKGK
jgi:hypothetical protein